MVDDGGSVDGIVMVDGSVDASFRHGGGVAFFCRLKLQR